MHTRRLAVYLRLSVEDREKKNESNSIRNQRKQIYDYIRNDPKLCKFEIAEFCDDGYSGTSRNRPGMKNLIDEMEKKQIQCVIVKDMSRFSRDYIEMGTYLNVIFPKLGVRFISLNDHYDSSCCQENTIGMETVFQTVLYDLYCRDISCKVKKSLENKCANGEYIFGQVPFGYEKSKETKNMVIIKEEEAEVVRYIFSLAMKGKKSTQIARQLYEEGIPTIAQMRGQAKNLKDKRIHTWSTNAIRRILNNRFYLGEMTYKKSFQKGISSREDKEASERERTVIKNHHESLVSEEMFEKAASFRMKKKRRDFSKKHPLTGKLYCGGCGYSMSYKPACKNSSCRYFECSRHAILKIPHCCTYIRAEMLEEIVLFMMNREWMLFASEREQQKAEIFIEKKICQLTVQEERGQKKYRNLQMQKNLLYEKYALGSLKETEYEKCFEAFMKQQIDLNREQEKCNLQIKKLKQLYETVKESGKDEESRYIRKLIAPVVELFIEKIYVYKDKRIEIIFKKVH